MDEQSVVYERQTLYDEIWEMPMRDVAQRYGVSGVALAKTCRKLGLPVPGRGYWAKQKVGKAEARPPLPPLQAGMVERIVAQRWEASAEDPPLSGLEDAVPIALAEPIVVSETLEDPHRLVALSARYLGKAEPRNGVVSAPYRSCLGICVSPASLDRALRIVDAPAQRVHSGATQGRGVTNRRGAAGAPRLLRPAAARAPAAAARHTAAL